MINDGYLRVTKANYEAEHQKVVEIYNRLYNQPNNTEYSKLKEDINPLYCWFKVEPKVSDDSKFSADKPNLKTYSKAIALGMVIETE